MAVTSNDLFRFSSRKREILTQLFFHILHSLLHFVIFFYFFFSLLLYIFVLCPWPLARCTDSFIIFIYMHPIIQNQRCFFFFCCTVFVSRNSSVFTTFCARFQRIAHPLHVKLINYWLSRCASYVQYVFVFFFALFCCLVHFHKCTQQFV